VQAVSVVWAQILVSVILAQLVFKQLVGVTGILTHTHTHTHTHLNTYTHTLAHIHIHNRTHTHIHRNRHRHRRKHGHRNTKTQRRRDVEMQRRRDAQTPWCPDAQVSRLGRKYAHMHRRTDARYSHLIAQICKFSSVLSWSRDQEIGVLRSEFEKIDKISSRRYGLTPAKRQCRPRCRAGAREREREKT